MPRDKKNTLQLSWTFCFKRISCAKRNYYAFRCDGTSFKVILCMFLSHILEISNLQDWVKLSCNQTQKKKAITVNLSKISIKAMIALCYIVSFSLIIINTNDCSLNRIQNGAFIFFINYLTFVSFGPFFFNLVKTIFITSKNYSFFKYLYPKLIASRIFLRSFSE